MENASKALLMAAGVLIGMLILSLAVYLFVSFGSTSVELHKQKEAQELEQFNSQFTSYVGKEGITIYDVVTVANLASENNKYYEYGPSRRIPTATSSDYYISVVLNTSPIENVFNNNIVSYDDLINNHLRTEMINVNNGWTLKQYTCQVEINTITGRVFKVTFT